MAERDANPNDESNKEYSPAQLAVQKAGKITGDLVCNLQKVRKTFLLIGKLLTEVRDRKYYVTLNHETMEDYADKHLDLSARAMYLYMKLYAWALENHKEWLEEPPKVRIPDLYEIEGLVWIEQELGKKDLAASREASLKEVQKKALAGKLRQKELRAFQRRASKTKTAIPRLIASTRALRKRYAKTKSEAAQKSLPLFDQIIGVMENDLIVETAGLGILDDWLPASDSTGFFSRNSMLT